jgi:hypothetical protein
MAEQKVIVLKYIGAGAYVTGIPACDLSEADIAASGFSADQLLALPGLFERVTQTPVVAFEPQHNDEDNEVSRK